MRMVAVSRQASVSMLTQMIAVSRRGNCFNAHGVFHLFNTQELRCPRSYSLKLMEVSTSNCAESIYFT